jgi:uncharacterized protein (DUF2235 family)
MKNIIICCDGTDNKLTINTNTNVLHLYSCLVKSKNQICYYNPGVGTVSPDGLSTRVERGFYTIWDKMTAFSLEKNVRDAYVFLMNAYEEGDQIYLFGFSRGAYTVRMLSGIIEMFGLLDKGNEGHFRHILALYSKADNKFHLGTSFKKRFAQRVPIHFIGIWDTVIAKGGLSKSYSPFPHSYRLANAKTVRHAVAIDERRMHYGYFPVFHDHEDLKEVFFSGVHSDIGGSYPEHTSGLSKLSLEWMLAEVSQFGLKLEKKRVGHYLYSDDGTYYSPDYKQKIHNSLSPLFRISDIISPRFYSFHRLKKIREFISLWPPRTLRDTALIHQSVIDKIEDQTCNYRPRNLKNLDQYLVVQSGSIQYEDE